MLDEEGNDYVTKTDVFAAMKSHTNALASCVGRKAVDWKGLVPDVLNVDIHSVPQIEKSKLKMKRMLGRGAFGDVWLADWLRGDGDFMEVAVKRWRNDLSPSSGGSKKRKNDREKEKENEGEGEEEEEEEEKSIDNDTVKAMDLWIKELSVMLQLHHPNLMRLFGVCVEEQPAWLVMEVMRGRCLNDELTDPLGFVAMLEAFCGAFGAAVGVFGSLSGHLNEIARLKKSKPHDMEKKIALHEEKAMAFPSVEKLKKRWEGPLLQLRSFVTSMSVPLDYDVINQFVEAYETYWNERSRPAAERQQEMDKQVLRFCSSFCFCVEFDSCDICEIV